MRILNDYLTYTMALRILNAPKKQNMRLYRMIKRNYIEVVKVGSVALVDRKQFVDAAGQATRKAPERFPPYIASWPLRDLIDVNEAALILGVTSRTIQNLGNSFVIESIDLSPWGGHRLYSRQSITNEKNRRGMLAQALQRKRTPRSKQNGQV